MSDETAEIASIRPGCVLVVDDERNIRRTLRMVLEGEGVTVLEAADAESALDMLIAGAQSIDLVIVDVKLPNMSGLDLLEALPERLEERPLPLMILISGHATVSDAVRATRLGAFDFFEKPLSRDRVLVGVRNAFQRSAADRELARLRSKVRGEIICQAPPMKTLLRLVEKVARTRVRVLIHGESGTGKELIARAIHQASERASAPFVKVNCAAIPQSLIESELFGYEKGAFTGARNNKKGLFELAHGGTIFLDEIGDMDLEAQAKVLRVLQSGEFMRVGGHEPISVDVRVVAATHRRLSELVDSGSFREDLYFRLNVVPLELPALRERPGDIPVLVRHFIDEACREFGMNSKQIDAGALDSLMRYSWPGNVRELKNVVERMVVLSESDLTLNDVPEDLRQVDGEEVASENVGDELELSMSTLSEVLGLQGDGDTPLSLKNFRETAEKAYIAAVLRAQNWNVSRTAEILGVERTHLHRKLKLLGLQRGGG
jgi:DNA-binding NtrC family response regulator